MWYALSLFPSADNDDDHVATLAITSTMLEPIFAHAKRQNRKTAKFYNCWAFSFILMFLPNEMRCKHQALSMSCVRFSQNEQKNHGKTAGDHRAVVRQCLGERLGGRHRISTNQKMPNDWIAQAISRSPCVTCFAIRGRAFRKLFVPPKC